LQLATVTDSHLGVGFDGSSRRPGISSAAIKVDPPPPHHHAEKRALRAAKTREKNAIFPVVRELFIGFDLR
jgi:hypothetical protein